MNDRQRLPASRRAAHRDCALFQPGVLGSAAEPAIPRRRLDVDAPRRHPNLRIAIHSCARGLLSRDSIGATG